MRSLLLSFLLSLIFSDQIFAQTLSRNPYLQALTPNSIKVMWSTSEPVKGWVKYGTDPTNLSITINESADNKDHMLQITGLNPYSIYYYAIGHGDVQLAGDDTHFFRTSKVTGDTTGFTAWIIGDFGGGSQDQIDVRTSFMDFRKTKEIDTWFWLGDNAYSDGTQEEYQYKVFDEPYGYKSVMKNLAFYTTPGNHDYNSVNRLDAPEKHKGPYFDIIEVPQNGEAGGVPSKTELYYSFDYGHTHIVSINSELFQWTGLPNSKMEVWLREDLEKNKQPWVVVMFHQPPYSKGSHDSDDFYEIFMKNMRTRFNPIFDKYGVDIVLCGHSHVYERSVLMHKHYVNSYGWDPAKNQVMGGSGNPDLGETYIKDESNAGTVYAVIGNSGKSEDDDNERLPFMIVDYSGGGVCGSMIMEVRGGQMTCTYINKKGEVIDKFAIAKDISSSTPTAIKDNFAKEIKLEAYPNPAKESVNIRFNVFTPANAVINVFDIQGRQLISQAIKATSGQNQINISEWKKLPAGEYSVHLELDGKPATIQIVKVN
jgi:hypothetical protein